MAGLGDMATAHAAVPVCASVIVRPALVMVAVRAAADVFASIV